MSYDGLIPLVKINPINIATYVNNILQTWGLRRRIAYLKPIGEADALVLGDGAIYFVIPTEMNGMNLTEIIAKVYTVSTLNKPSFAIYNLTKAQDMLSTNCTIDANELSSLTASVPAVIDTTKDDVATGDVIRIDVDAIGTGTKGCDIALTFAVP